MKRLIAAWSALVVLLLVTLVQASPQIQPLDMQNFQINNLAAGTVSSDAANIGQTINSVTTSGTGLIAQTAASTWATRTLTATTDVTSITNGDGVSGNPTIDLADKLKAGWVPGGTWTYASATTITIASGGAAKYAVGDKLELVQTTTKYFYVIGVADTTLTITGGSSYTLTNAAISANYYSHDEPVGFPKVFSYTPTITGFAGTPPSNTVNQFSLSGGVCTVFIRQVTAGTSTETFFTISAPIVAKTVSNGAWNGPLLDYTNNSAAGTAAARGEIASGSSTITLYTSLAAGAWTNANNKRAAYFTISYPII